MRIKRLALHDVRLHESTDIRPNRVNWIAGPGRSGKTTLLESLRLMLAGRNQWLSYFGNRLHGTARFIMNGGHEARLEMQTAAPDTHRVLVVSENKNEKPPSMWQDPTVVHACLVTRHFLRMSDKEQQDLLFGLMGTVVDRESILASITRMDNKERPAKVGSWRDVGDFLARYWGEEWPADAYEAAKEVRKAEKALKKNVEERVKSGHPGEIPAIVTESEVDKLRALHQQLVASQAALQERARGAASVSDEQAKAYKSELSEWELLKRQRVAAQTAFDKANGEQSSLHNGLHPKDPKQPSADIRKAMDGLDVEMGVAKAEKDEASQALRSASTGACPPGQCFRVTSSALHAKIATASDAVDALQEKKDGLQRELMAAIKAENAVADHDAALKRATDALKKADADLAALPPLGDKPEAPAPPATDEALAAEIQDAQAAVFGARSSITEAEAKRKTYDTWARASDIHADLCEELAQREMQVAYWEAAVKALAPDGVPAIINQSTVAILTDQANKIAAYFNTEVSMKLPWSVWAFDSPIVGLSGSEEAMASVVFQVLIARLSGLGIVAVDEHGMDPLQRPALLKMLIDQADIQSFVSSLLNKVENGQLVPPSLVGHPDVNVYHVHAGQVDLVGAQIHEVAA